MQNARYLSEVARGRDNNLNLIRMLAAIGVLVSHAFPISRGASAIEPLEVILGGTTLGAVCVMVFFAISGFLIAKSFDQSQNLARFVAARILRLFPALIVALGVTIIVSSLWLSQVPGPIFWDSAAEYFVRNLALYPLQYELPGVFEDNPYGSTINGSLWTLRHEVTCYVGVAGLGLFGILKKRRLMIGAFGLFLAFYLAVQFLTPHPMLTAFARLALPFMMGAALYVLRDHVPLSAPIGIGLCIIAAISRFSPIFFELFSIALVYCVFLIAYIPSGGVRRYNKLGDYSYGAYIYAFPVQQLMVSISGPMTPIENIAMSLPLVLLLAVISWKFVEKPSLNLYRRNWLAIESRSKRFGIASTIFKMKYGAPRRHHR